MSLKRKDLLSLASLSAEEITLILRNGRLVQGSHRPRDQEGAGFARSHRREPLLRAQHQNPHVV